MRTQEIGHINQKADRMLSFLEGLDEEMVSTDTSPSEGFAKLLAPNKDNREPQTLAQKSFVSETFYGHEILVHKAHQALISPLPRDFINIWSRQQYQGHLGHIRLLQNMRLFTRIGINPLEIKPSHVLEFGPGVGGL
ncbi:hypothetical protein CKO40_20610 [Halochromatium glycolicum]|uniref:Uncharacterized protein n=2 Tax=Halochromatium glycolicum TaxID=85075 RepID=A0AAJ0U7Z1_9GAMM|nr:hypothetical protein [Halochromatium glycolicum]